MVFAVGTDAVVALADQHQGIVDVQFKVCRQPLTQQYTVPIREDLTFGKTLVKIKIPAFFFRINPQYHGRFGGPAGGGQAEAFQAGNYIGHAFRSQ